MKSPYRIFFENKLFLKKGLIRGKTLNVAAGAFPYRNLSSNMITVDLFERNPLGELLDLDVKADISLGLPFKDDSFDTVMCTNVLEHMRHPRFVVSESARVLKKGGIFVLAVPFMERYHGDPDDYWRFTHKGVFELLRGFCILDHETIGGRYLFLANFLYRHRFVPRFLVKAFFRITLNLKENNPEKWTTGFLTFARKD